MSAAAPTTPAAGPAPSALASTDRPAAAGSLSASAVFGWRGVLKIKHVPEQLLDVIGLPVIFTLMFTYLFGGALAGSIHSYLQFLLPGTLAMTIVLLTMYSGTGLNTDVTRGVFDRFRSMPIWRPAPIIGALLGDVGRYLLASALVLGLGFALGFRPAGGAAGVLAGVGLLLVFAFGLSWIWLTLGLVMRSPSGLMNTGLLVLFPLTLASNIFVEPQTTPGWVQAFIKVNPVTHLVAAERGLMQGAAAASQVAWVLLAAAAMTAVFAPLTVVLYGRKG